MFRVQGLGFRVQDLGFRVEDLRFYGLGHLGVWCLGCRTSVQIAIAEIKLSGSEMKMMRKIIITAITVESLNPNL